MARLEDDLHAAVAADRELGAGYEAAVVRALAERLDTEIDRRVQERVDARLGGGGAGGGGLDFFTLVLILGSLAMALGVPGAIHGHVGSGGTIALTIVAWVAIASINVAVVLGRRRP